MPRSALIAGNWKLHHSPSEGAAVLRDLLGRLGEQPPAELVVCPTFIGIPAAIEATRGTPIAIGAQHCHWDPSGAFTGEVSAALLASAAVSHVLIGHSERRQLFGESDASVNKRLRAALEAGLVPIVCVGETLEERDGGQLEQVLRRQLSDGLDGLGADALQNLVVAYEPVWAIGTGRVAGADQAQEAHAFIRSVLRDLHGELADRLRILYGGSVKPDNAAGLLAQDDIDGALVGGASLKAEHFAGIIAAVTAAA